MRNILLATKVKYIKNMANSIPQQYNYTSESKQQSNKNEIPITFIRKWNMGINELICEYEYSPLEEDYEIREQSHIITND